MEKARDISPQILRLNYDGQTYELKFNNAAMRAAEDVYDAEYKKDDCSWFNILEDLSKGKSGAIMAVYFGALKGKLTGLTFEEFEEKFKLSDIPEVAEKLSEAVSQSLPKASGSAAKNA